MRRWRLPNQGGYRSFSVGNDRGLLSGLGDPDDRGVAWLVVVQHVARTPGCENCGPDGCWLFDWAELVAAQDLPAPPPPADQPDKPAPSSEDPRSPEPTPPAPPVGPVKEPRPRWRRRSIGQAVVRHRPLRPYWRCGGCDQPWPCHDVQQEINSGYALNPARTTADLGELLHQAAGDLGISADAIRWWFLPWTDALIDEDTEHPLDRYTWDCAVCGCPWPCSPARVEIAEAYSADPLGLAAVMGRLLIEAAEEGELSEDELTERFVSWVERLSAAPVELASLPAAGLRRWCVVSARRSLLTHWPGHDGRCRMCEEPACWEWATAAAYLDEPGPLPRVTGVTG